MNKREFIKTLGLASLALPLSAKAYMSASPDGFNPDADMNEEAFWETIRKQYRLKPDYINLENGYYNILPHDTMEFHLEQIRKLNREGSYYMRTAMASDRMHNRELLSAFLNCPTEEIIITRNTTESMDTVIAGYDWKAGDHAIMAEQDYGSMLDMFRQQAKRFGMVNTLVQIPMHPSNDEEIVALYENAITEKTRLIMVCHMINITGQILPVRKICDMAHRHGVKVLVDGAHAVGHFEFNITDLNCDFYASSLHKWLSVPLGAGLLYVRKDNIRDLWPLFGEQNYGDDDIRKLNHTGTIPVHTELSIPAAIAFYRKIGGKRKEERLRFLQNYWTSAVRDLPGVRVNTPVEAQRSCGIANVGIEKLTAAGLAEALFETYHIWTVAIDSAGVKGCRITPNVFTTTDELDTLVKALKALSGN